MTEGVNHLTLSDHAAIEKCSGGPRPPASLPPQRGKVPPKGADEGNREQHDCYPAVNKQKWKGHIVDIVTRKSLLR